MHAQEGGPYARQIALQRIERAVAGRVPVRSFPIGREKAPSIDFSIGQVGERLVEDEHGRNHEVWQHVRGNARNSALLSAKSAPSLLATCAMSV